MNKILEVLNVINVQYRSNCMTIIFLNQLGQRNYWKHCPFSMPEIF
jgi:hypothetical protein